MRLLKLRFWLTVYVISFLWPLLATLLDIANAYVTGQSHLRDPQMNLVYLTVLVIWYRVVVRYVMDYIEPKIDHLRQEIKYG